jgi:hypothetical protein
MALSKIKGSQLSDDSITVDQIADTAVHGRRNLIINGAMQVSQRGTSSTSSGVHTCDRWNVNFQTFDQLAITQSQSTTAPSGFANSLKVEVTTAETAQADDELLYIRTRLEAQDLQRLNYGESSAKALTLSFWVRSSLTGKYSVLVYQDDAIRSVTESFNISTADTWEYKTITIDGDTSGTIDNNNGPGISIYFTLSSGGNFAGTPHSGWGAYSATDDFSFSDQVDFAAQTGTFYITGLQLEVGDTATPFEHRSFGEELALCNRYYYVLGDGSISSNSLLGNGFGWASGQVELVVNYPVQMRSAPTLKQPSGTDKYNWASGSGSIVFDNLTIYQPNRQNCLIYSAGLSGVTQGRGYRAHLNDDSDGYVAFDAEL